MKGFTHHQNPLVENRPDEPEYSEQLPPQFWFELDGFKNLSEDGAKSLLHAVVAELIETERACISLEEEHCNLNGTILINSILNSVKEIFQEAGYSEAFTGIETLEKR